MFYSKTILCQTLLKNGNSVLVRPAPAISHFKDMNTYPRGGLLCSEQFRMMLDYKVQQFKLVFLDYQSK